MSLHHWNKLDADLWQCRYCRVHKARSRYPGSTLAHYRYTLQNGDKLHGEPLECQHSIQGVEK